MTVESGYSIESNITAVWPSMSASSNPSDVRPWAHSETQQLLWAVSANIGISRAFLFHVLINVCLLNVSGQL